MRIDSLESVTSSLPDTQSRGEVTRAYLLFLILLVAAAFLTKPSLIGGDEPHYAAMTASVAFDRDFDLSNQYRDIELNVSGAAGKRFAGKRLDQHLVQKVLGPQFSHPIGLPVLASPFLWVATKILRAPWPDPILLLLTVAFCAAGLACGCDLLRRFLGEATDGRILGVIFFCSSPLWFYSRTFFTEPFVWSVVVAGVWFISRSRFLVGGVFLGLAVIFREPALLLVLPIILGVWALRGLKALLQAGVSTALALAVVAARNLFLNGGGIFDFPQPFQYGNWAAGAWGLVSDGSHGLVPFMPLALLAPIGFFLGRNRTERVVLGCCAAAACSYFLLAACWIDWRGGSCFGPRLVLPIIPFLAPAIGLVWQRLGSGPLKWFAITLAAIGAGIEVAAIANPFFSFWSPSIVDLVSRSRTAIATFILGASAAFAFARRLGVRNSQT